jgi:hypothetical protein
MPSCVDDGLCHFRRLENLFSDFIDGMEIRLWLAGLIPSSHQPRAQRYLFYREWSAEAQEFGLDWSAVAATFFQLLPNVTQLSMNTSNWPECVVHYWAGHPQQFPPGLIIGFSKLALLKTTFVPPWVVLKTLTLRTLHIDFSAADIWYEFTEEGPGSYHIDKDDCCEHVKTMILDLNITALETLDNSESFRLKSAYTTVMKVQQYLTGLRDFRIHFSHKEMVNGEYYESILGAALTVSYAGLALFLDLGEVESVSIDASAVNWVTYRDTLAVAESS